MPDDKQSSFTLEQWTRTDYRRLVDTLQSMAEESFLAFHQRLVPDVKNLLGVRLPKLQQLAAAIARGNAEAYIALSQDTFYEETMLCGLVIGRMKAPLADRLKWVARFVPRIDNWAVCDSFCTRLTAVRKEPEKGLVFLEPYLCAQEEFPARFGYVMLMDHLVDETYLPRIYDACDRSCCGAYYTQMAIAWLLSVCYVKFPEQTERYLYNNRLSDWTYQKSLQKIIESGRVSPEAKAHIRRMKQLRGKGTAPAAGSSQ